MAGRSTKFIGTGHGGIRATAARGKRRGPRARCALDLVDALSDWRNQMSNGYSALHAAIGLHYGTVVAAFSTTVATASSRSSATPVTWRSALETLANSLALRLGSRPTSSCGCKRQSRTPHGCP
ncbi:hypothetical protein F2981_29285 (plasmid) [Sinorhizobium meliloti]|nr:hypothetical protein [Sinorhizobium meliloti]